MTCPLFVELCAGTAAVSLRLHGGPHARPPVSRMGAKTGYAHAILRVLGLRQGQGHVDGTRYLLCEPDPGVRLLLHAYTDRDLATAAAKIIRSWKDEDPKELWLRLKAEGPAVCPDVGMDAREVAKFARLLSSNRLIPATWSEDGRWVNTARDGGPGTIGGASFGGDDYCTSAEAIAGKFESVCILPATIRTDARTVDPREVARWARIVTCNELIALDSQTWENTGAGGSTFAGNTAHGFYRPIARLAAGLDTSPTIPATIHDDARTIEPASLPPGTVAYMDPPYQDTTGYGHLFPRDEVVEVARRWRDAGALVCVSEAVPIPELVAEGWHTLDITDTRKGQKRTFSKQQREWLTMSEAPKWRPSVARDLFGNR